MSHKPKRDTAGRTHLHRACGRGVVTDVESILEQSNELINSEDNAGYMPIHEASLHGHLDVVKVLVKYGAAYDVQSSIDLESPLLDAVENSHVPVVKYLLQLGADPRKRDKQGRSCLDANKEGSESLEIREEIEALLKTAINKQRAQRPSDDENNNKASIQGDRDSHSSRDPSVTSPIRHSPPSQNALPSQNIRRRNARAEQSRKDLLWLDSGKGSVIKLREKAREGDLQMVHALLETGLKPDTEALVGAIKGGHTELVSLLLAYEAEADPVPGQGDRDGRKKRDVSMPVGEETPMLAAIGRGNVTILQYLLENGVDPRRLDSKGKSYPEIAREREGEYWQEEVQMLKEAWRKAGAETKSPLRRKSPPKRKSSINPMRRNSSASSTRNQSRPPATTIKDGNLSKRSLSVNPSHRFDDPLDTSDQEFSAENFSKYSLGKARRTETDNLNLSVAKKRRRLVSGKVRDEEAARVVEPLRSVPENDIESSTGPRKPNFQSVQSDFEDTIRVEQFPHRIKIEPTDSPKMDNSVPFERSNSVKRERSTARSTSTHREPKSRNHSKTRNLSRPRNISMSRNISPPWISRSEIEKEQLRKRRREDHHDDRFSPWRDSIADSDHRRLKEGRLPEYSRRGSVSSESSRRREEFVRSSKGDAEKFRQPDEDRRKRIKDIEREKDRETTDKERREKSHREERFKEARDKEKRQKGQTEEVSHRQPQEFNQKQVQEEARELMRKKHSIREINSTQKKQSKVVVDRRADEVVAREFELRRLREDDERKQRIVRDREGYEQEERKVGKQGKVTDTKVREQTERNRASRDNEVRERDHRDREEKFKEREKVARQKAEREQIEKDTREAEERTKREKQLQEERRKEVERFQEAERELCRKEEEERLRKQAEIAERHKTEEFEKHRLEEECRQIKRNEELRNIAIKEEEARKHRELEREKAESEAKERKLVEDQLAREKERRCIKESKELARIQSLPHALRVAAENEASGNPPEGFRNFVPLFTANFPSLTSSDSPSLNGNRPTDEKWALNIQISLALGTSDLNLSGYPQIERRTATEHERLRMWSVLSPILCENLAWSTKSMDERAASRIVEREKFLSMQPVFWIKISDVLSIISSEPRHQSLHLYPLTTVEVAMDLPTPGDGSPHFTGQSQPTSCNNMAARILRRFSTHEIKSLDNPL